MTPDQRRRERREQRRKRRERYAAKGVSAGTRRAYASRWRQWEAWCRREDVPVWDGPAPEDMAGYIEDPKACTLLEADPIDVADFLTEAADAGKARKTINGYASAIGYIYGRAKLADPTKHGEVTSVLDGIQRETGETVGQAEPLCEAEAEKLYMYLSRFGIKPRRKVPSFRLMVCVMVMRDGLLRVSECTGIRWEDIEWPDVEGWPTKIKWSNPDPRTDGLLELPKSKTDQLGDGDFRWLSPETINHLYLWHAMNGFPKTGKAFPITETWLMAEIRNACEGAGLGKGFRSHSCRIGMAIDLRKRGVSIEKIRLAGGWKTRTMVRHYLKSYEAKQNPVKEAFQDVSDG